MCICLLFWCRKVLSIKLRSSLPQPNQASLSTSANQTLFVVVFGYPQPRYSLTVAHFEALAAGGTIKAELENDVENAFKIGFIHPWEAARALRRNGEIISGEGGRWVVGVKWAVSFSPYRITSTNIYIESLGSVSCSANLGCRCSFRCAPVIHES